MINPVNSVSYNSLNSFKAKTRGKNNIPILPPNNNNTVKTSIFYINDYHGKSINMEKTVTAVKAFDSFVPSVKTDKLKLSSGDIMLGEAENNNNVSVAFLNLAGITASAAGNHEFDLEVNQMDHLLKKAKFKMLAGNVNIAPENPMSRHIEKSYIEEHDGNKYGIIGLAPTDFFSRVKYGKIFEQMKVDNLDDTIKDVQKEVDKLRAQNVNKIILLSHCGYGYDIKIAQNTEGVDVILGGHTHTLIKDIKENKNLFYSKTGEPVVITQAGRDGKNFGILNLEFNTNGVITRVQNNVAETSNFPQSAIAKYVFESILGKPEVVGFIKSAPPPLKKDLLDPSAHGNFIVDCIKDKLHPEIVLIGSALIRSYFEPGKIDTRKISDLSPFKNTLVETNYTEKELVDAFKLCAKSFLHPDMKPGIFYTSGLRYSVSKHGELKEMSFIDKSGNVIPIDINNPRTNKTYKCIINSFYAAGNDGYTMLDKIKTADKIYDFDLCKCVEDYFRNRKEPVDIVDDGRFKVVE